MKKPVPDDRAEYYSPIEQEIAMKQLVDVLAFIARHEGDPLTQEMIDAKFPAILPGDGKRMCQ